MCFRSFMFQRSTAVRQAWIVVEWMERYVQDKLDDFYEQVEIDFGESCWIVQSFLLQVQYFTDATVC